MSISYAARRLAKAFNYPFDEPVTAYLTEVVVVACCGFGVMYRRKRSFHDVLDLLYVPKGP